MTFPRGRHVLLALAVAAAGCASSPARMSQRIYEHESRAAASESIGLHDVAAGERLRAQLEREQLSRSEHVVFARDDR